MSLIGIALSSPSQKPLAPSQPSPDRLSETLIQLPEISSETNRQTFTQSFVYVTRNLNASLSGNAQPNSKLNHCLNEESVNHFARLAQLLLSKIFMFQSLPTTLH